MNKSITLLLTFSALFCQPLQAAFFIDDHGACCYQRERVSRYVWLGGAALVGAGAGAAAGYAAGGGKGNPGKRGEQGPRGSNAPMDSHHEIEISATFHPENYGDVLFRLEIFGPAGTLLHTEEQWGRALSTHVELFRYSKRAEKGMGVYTVHITPIETVGDIAFSTPCFENVTTKVKWIEEVLVEGKPKPVKRDGEETIVVSSPSRSTWSLDAPAIFQFAFFPPYSTEVYEEAQTPPAT